jgi:hypothetical protein
VQIEEALASSPVVAVQWRGQTCTLVASLPALLPPWRMRLVTYLQPVATTHGALRANRNQTLTAAGECSSWAT